MDGRPVRRPVSAFALSLTSGILILLGALVFLLISNFFLVFSLVGLALGTIILIASVLMYARPKEHAIWGVVVLVSACVSIVSIGGFIAGMILGIIGGAVAIAWRPEGLVFGGYAPTPAYGSYGGKAAYGPYGAPTMAPYGGPPAGAYGVPVTPWRMCMGCGRWIPWTYNVCPLCGTQTPVAGWVPRAAEAPPATASFSPGGLASPPTPMAPPVYAAPTQAPSIAAPAAPASPPPKEPCPTCTGEAEWNAAAGRWYCPAESKYF